MKHPKGTTRPLDPEPVLRKLADDLKAEKRVFDKIRSDVEADPGPRVGQVLIELGRMKAHLSRALKVAERVTASSGPIGVHSIVKNIEAAHAAVQEKLERWNTKSNTWIEVERVLLMAEDKQPKKLGRGNRSFPDYIYKHAASAVNALIERGHEQSDAARRVAERLKPFLPHRRHPAGKSSYEFSGLSLLKSLRKHKLLRRNRS